MASVNATIATKVTLSDSIPAGSNVITAYAVPCNPDDASLTTMFNPGTGPHQANKFYQHIGTPAASTPDTLDLTAVIASDGTTGLTHVRDGFVFNNDPNAVLTLFGDTNSLASRFLGGTTPTVIIQPLTFWRIPPILLAAIGYLLDATHKTIKFDPGTSATAAYKLIIIGD